MSVATLWNFILQYTFLYYVLICNQKAENKNTVFSEVLQLVPKCGTKISWAAAGLSVSCPPV